jgi:hypothetical protein
MTKKSTKSKQKPSASEPREVTRHIPANIAAMLWGMAGGRCEFDGCNKILYRSSVTKEQVNIAQKAHIYAFSEHGPRGNEGVSDDDLNALGNLMLVCHECHVKIDHAPDGGRYTAALLQAMKARHERRIEIVTGIAPGRQSHVLLYGANIGEHNLPLSLNEAAGAMFPDRYPAEATPISLGSIDSSFRDRTDEFWKVESTTLKTHFDRRVRERIEGQEIKHLSVFAITPQPILILLGTLLGDIVPADVYQRHREPATWAWPASSANAAFELREPETIKRFPALILSLSATIVPERIHAVLGEDVSIWTITISEPHNDFVKSRAQLAEFRRRLRPLLDRIKAVHGQATPLHVFPAVPVSLAVEFGRIRMPKADMPWRIYDQVNSRGGFVPALSIPSGD